MKLADEKKKREEKEREKVSFFSKVFFFFFFVLTCTARELGRVKSSFDTKYNSVIRGVVVCLFTTAEYFLIGIMRYKAEYKIFNFSQ